MRKFNERENYGTGRSKKGRRNRMARKEIETKEREMKEEWKNGRKTEEGTGRKEQKGGRKKGWKELKEYVRRRKTLQNLFIDEGSERIIVNCNGQRMELCPVYGQSPCLDMAFSFTHTAAACDNATRRVLNFRAHKGTHFLTAIQLYQILPLYSPGTT
jgi:hypothetical protein